MLSRKANWYGQIIAMVIDLIANFSSLLWNHQHMQEKENFQQVSCRVEKFRNPAVLQAQWTHENRVRNKVETELPTKFNHSK